MLVTEQSRLVSGTWCPSDLLLGQGPSPPLSTCRVGLESEGLDPHAPNTDTCAHCLLDTVNFLSVDLVCPGKVSGLQLLSLLFLTLKWQQFFPGARLPLATEPEEMILGHAKQPYQERMRAEF